MSTLSLQRGEKPVEVVRKPHKTSIQLQREAAEAAAKAPTPKKSTTKSK